jgi:hypothetical protein
MKNILLLVTLYFSSTYALYGQNVLPEPEMKTITFQELISNLTTGSDSVYELKNAIVEFSESTDSRYGYNQYRSKDKAFTDSIIDIRKKVIFDNVRFGRNSPRDFNTIAGWHFYKKVQFENTRGVFVNHSIFEDAFIVTEGKIIGEPISHNLIVEHCVFNAKFSVVCYSENEQFGISIENNVFNETRMSVTGNFSTNPNLMINVYKLQYVNFRFNKINYNQSSFLFQIGNTDLMYFEKNEIKSNPIVGIIFS